MTKEEAKHLSEVLKAYSDGKKLQIKSKTESSEWSDVNELGLNYIDFEYRIKPEPKLRPYKDAEEFLNAQKEHGPYIIGNCPFIPLKIYEDAIVYDLQKDMRGFEKMFYFVDLADRFTWQDGHPCGITEE